MHWLQIEVCSRLHPPNSLSLHLGQATGEEKKKKDNKIVALHFYLFFSNTLDFTEQDRDEASVKACLTSTSGLHLTHK